MNDEPAKEERTKVGLGPSFIWISPPIHKGRRRRRQGREGRGEKEEAGGPRQFVSENEVNALPSLSLELSPSFSAPCPILTSAESVRPTDDDTSNLASKYSPPKVYRGNIPNY